MLLLLQIGELLGMSLSSVRELPASEITIWMAYFKLKNTPKETVEKEVSTVDKFKQMMGGDDSGKTQTR